MRCLQMFFGAIVLTLTACGGGKTNKETGGLKPERYATLASLNQEQVNNQEAFNSVVGQVFGQAVQSVAKPSEKVQKMTDLLRDSNCATLFQPVPKGFQQNWQGRTQISGAACPVFLNDERSYDAQAKRLVFSTNFSSKSTAYQEVNAINTGIARGEIALQASGAQKTITGAATFDRISVRDLGELTANIETRQVYSSDRGRGRLVMNLRLEKKWQHQAAIDWDVRSDAPKFYVDGNEIERANFLELFSSYGLIEIMENSLQMR
jgi:hypothetical protein